MDKTKVIRSILSFGLKLVVFCAIWMLLGVKIIDINSHPATEMFGFENGKLCFLLYGISLFIGCSVICICAKKITKLIKK